MPFLRRCAWHPRAQGILMGVIEDGNRFFTISDGICEECAQTVRQQIAERFGVDLKSLAPATQGQQEPAQGQNRQHP